MLRLLAWTCTAAVLGAPGSLRAQGIQDDTALARTYFEAGTADFARGDYVRALSAFEEARRLRPLPALDYDIATCYERLDRPAMALELFQRYLDEAPNAENAVAVRARIHALQHRSDRERRRFIAPGVLGGVAVVLGAVGAGLVGSIPGPLHDLDARWATDPTAALQDRAHSLQDRAIAGYVVLGAAGVAALVDVGLWVRAARKGRR